MRNSFLLTAVAALCAPGCSDASAESRDALPIAFGLPRWIAVDGFLSRMMVSEAICQATSGSGSALRRVQSGTLAIGVDGIARYEPNPVDRLVVQIDRHTHEFWVRDLRIREETRQALASARFPHHVRFVHRCDDLSRLEIVADFDGDRVAMGIKGWRVQAGKRYQVDLKVAGSSIEELDSGQRSWRVEYSLEGRITGEQFQLRVDERHSLVMPVETSLRLLHVRRDRPVRLRATLNNELVSGRSSFRMQDVRIETGRQVGGESGVIRASGEVVAAGKVFGQVSVDGARIVLRTKSGVIPLALERPDQ